MEKQVYMVQLSEVILSTWVKKTDKIRKIKNCAEYDVKKDYYKQIRDYIKSYHKSGKELSQFAKVTDIVSNSKKQKTYKPLIDAYKIFLNTNRPFQYFDAPREKWIWNGLEVIANPEIGLEINGTKYLIKLYFKLDTLSKQSADILLWVMEEAFRNKVDSDIKMAVLDVKRFALNTGTMPNSDMKLSIQAEAKYISDMWDVV